ncbi:hypothetical protein RNP24_20545, partial [Escherichia coli]|nr:hypothetical protein [Escherichia coli]
MNKTITALAILMASFAANASVLPETPVPFKSGTGAIDNDTVYIGLGSAGTAWYKLDTQAKDKKWTALAAFPGNDSNLLIVFYVQIMPDDFVMQLHR